MVTLAEPTFTRLHVSPLTVNIGAEIEGVDLREKLPDAVIAEIRQALLKWKVIFFRDQDMTQEQHIALGRRFGDLEIHPLTDADQPNPEILHIKTGTRVATAASWHSDVTWREAPPLGSILRARTLPKVGGDTMWSDQAAAYEGLSPAMKDWVCTLTALHDGSQFKDRTGGTAESFWDQFPVQEHPVVRTHPETGERALYVNRNFTVGIKGLSDKESAWLLQHLFDQAAKPEYQVRYRWQVNSVAFWDNRACQHYAVNDYAPEIRHMERVTVVGDRPFFDPLR
jgi:taurine dioxygenase